MIQVLRLKNLKSSQVRAQSVLKLKENTQILILVQASFQRQPTQLFVMDWKVSSRATWCETLETRRPSGEELTRCQCSKDHQRNLVDLICNWLSL